MQLETEAQSPLGKGSLGGKRKANWELWILAFLIPFIILLSVIRLGNHPKISGWDEGIYLQFASNLANHGEYATLNGSQFERLVPVGGTGSTLFCRFL